MPSTSTRFRPRAARLARTTVGLLTLLLAACGGGGTTGRPVNPLTFTLTALDPMYTVNSSQSISTGAAVIAGSFQQASAPGVVLIAFDLDDLPVGAQVTAAELRLPVTHQSSDPQLVPDCTLDHDGRDTPLLDPGAVDLGFEDESLATLGAPVPQPGAPPRWSAAVGIAVKADREQGHRYAVFRVRVDPTWTPPNGVWAIDYEIAGPWDFNGIRYLAGLRVTYTLP